MEQQLQRKLKNNKELNRDGVIPTFVKGFFPLRFISCFIYGKMIASEWKSILNNLLKLGTLCTRREIVRHIEFDLFHNKYVLER